MTTAAIHQPQYLPYLGFFHKLEQADIFVLLDDARFQKNGLQNRNKIKNDSERGWQWLTVPVLHEFGQLIREVRINPDVDWPRKHWTSIRTSYGRAPHFARHAEALERIYSRAHSKLDKLNLELTRWACRSLEIDTPIVLSSELQAAGEQTERLVSLCRAVGADAYLSGPGGRRYLERERFEAAGIEVAWQRFTSPTYEQVFPKRGFTPDLAVVDALMCCGPDARRFIVQPAG